MVNFQFFVQHCGLGAAVGSAGPAGHANAAQLGTTDPGAQPVGSERRRAQGVLDDVQALRQGEERPPQPPRVQVVPPRSWLRPPHGGRGSARPGVRSHPRYATFDFFLCSGDFIEFFCADVVDPNRDGFVSLQEYMAFMISKETENVQSSEEIENAFRAITAGDRPYVTKEELYAVSQLLLICVWNLTNFFPLLIRRTSQKKWRTTACLG
jgi:Ca2+ insensitive EF hand